MNAEGRAGLRSLTDAATPGPWVAYFEPEHSDTSGVCHESGEPDIVSSVSLTLTGEDSQFIAAARAGVPDLLDTLDAILAVHVKGKRFIIDEVVPACIGCDQSWPCSTVRAIEGAS